MRGTTFLHQDHTQCPQSPRPPSGWERPNTEEGAMATYTKKDSARNKRNATARPGKERRERQERYEAALARRDARRKTK